MKPRKEIENYKPDEKYKDASDLSCIKFQEKYGGTMRLWGHPYRYVCVQIGQHEFLWRLDNGKYDGWNLGVT